MPIVYIDIDEAYPVYSITKRRYGADPIDLTDKQIAFIKEAERTYDKAQGIMRKKVEKLEEQRAQEGE